MAGPEQPKVIGEELSDQRIQSFVFPEGGLDPAISADYQVLNKAYVALRSGDFERFLAYFQKAGRDVNALDASGKTFLDRVSEHRRGQPFVAALTAVGGKTAAELGQ